MGFQNVAVKLFIEDRLLISHETFFMVEVISLTLVSLWVFDFAFAGYTSKAISMKCSQELAYKHRGIVTVDILETLHTLVLFLFIAFCTQCLTISLGHGAI
jgi:hypothetical protein